MTSLRSRIGSFVLLTVATCAAGLLASGEASAQDQATRARNAPRILNGGHVPPGKGPWAASIQYQTVAGDAETFRHFCGGSFVSPNYSLTPKPTFNGWEADNPRPHWIVTAAHCVFDDDGKLIDASRLSVLGGARDRSNPDGKGERQGVDKILAHPGFDRHTLVNDVALMLLAEPPEQSSLIPERRASIRLPNVSDAYWIDEPYLAVYAQGWGNTEQGSDSLKLKEVLLPIVDRDFCDRRFEKHGATILPGMLCAGFVDGNFDSCQGDSGGPLVYRAEGNIAVPRSGEPVLVGIVSWGIGCGRSDLFGVYTSASYYRPWIEARILEFAETGK